MNHKFASYSILVVLVMLITISLTLGIKLFIPILLTALYGTLLLKDLVTLRDRLNENIKKIEKVVKLLFMISIVIPLFMASGALPTAIVMIGNNLVGFDLVLSAFLFSLVLSMTLGTAIGTLTILVPLFSALMMTSTLTPGIIIGALVSGAYFGDRASPLSSVLHLVSNVTTTDFYANSKQLVRTSIIPLLISIGLFVLIGQGNRITPDITENLKPIAGAFDITILRIMPLVLLILMIQFRVPIVKSLLIIFSLLTFIFFIDGGSANDFINFLFNGYSSTDLQINKLLATSGFSKMSMVILVIFSSAFLNSVLEAGKYIDELVSPFLKNIKSNGALTRRASLLSMLLSVVTCNQALTAIVTAKFFTEPFDLHKVDREHLVTAIGNTGLNIVGIIPWNVNGLVVAALTGVATLEYIKYSYFIIVLTIYTLLISFNKKEESWS